MFQREKKLKKRLLNYSERLSYFGRNKQFIENWKKRKKKRWKSCEIVTLLKMCKKNHCDLTKILDLNICLKKQIKRWGKFVKWKQLLTAVIDEMIISPNIMIGRFYFYFQPLPTWVRRDSKIIADFSVDRERLLNMGYSNVFQCSAGASSKRGENTNSIIMDYLKRVVPRMFQVSPIVSLGFYILEPGLL